MFSPTRETFPACVRESKELLTTNTQTSSCLTRELLLNPQRTHVQQDVLAVTLETYNVLHSICRSSAHHGGNIVWKKSTVYVPLGPKSDRSNKKQHDLGANDAKSGSGSEINVHIYDSSLESFASKKRVSPGNSRSDGERPHVAQCLSSCPPL